MKSRGEPVREVRKKKHNDKEARLCGTHSVREGSNVNDEGRLFRGADHLIQRNRPEILIAIGMI